MELDDRFPIAWDASLYIEGELAEQLRSALELVRLQYAARVKADLAVKTQHDHTTPLVRASFAEDDSAYSR